MAAKDNDGCIGRPKAVIWMWRVSPQDLADPPFFCLREGDSAKVPVRPVRDRGFKFDLSGIAKYHIHRQGDLSLCIRQIGPAAELSAMRTTIIIKMLPRKRWVFDIDIDCLINIIARSPEF